MLILIRLNASSGKSWIILSYTQPCITVYNVVTVFCFKLEFSLHLVTEDGLNQAYLYILYIGIYIK